MVTQEDIKELHKLVRLGLDERSKLKRHKKREKEVKKGTERKMHFETIHDIREWMEQTLAGPECK